MRLSEYTVALQAVFRVISYCARHMPAMKTLLRKSIERFHDIYRVTSQSLERQTPKDPEYIVRMTRDLASGKVIIPFLYQDRDVRSWMEIISFLGVRQTIRAPSLSYGIAAKRLSGKGMRGCWNILAALHKRLICN